eukprot:5552581-Pyramimonas_sp.AAC.1
MDTYAAASAVQWAAARCIAPGSSTRFGMRFGERRIPRKVWQSVRLSQSTRRGMRILAVDDQKMVHARPKTLVYAYA